MVELIMQSPSAGPYLPVGYLPLNPNPKCLFSISIQNYIFLNSRTCMLIYLHCVFFPTCTFYHVPVWRIEKKKGKYYNPKASTEWVSLTVYDKRIEQWPSDCFVFNYSYVFICLKITILMHAEWFGSAWKTGQMYYFHLWTPVSNLHYLTSLLIMKITLSSVQTLFFKTSL